ncbi:bestrophin family protein [Methylobacterium sp. CB376]|nr:bestrophin family protein [Methylobacterium nodulans]WFT81109.1 bestrophin family protein [Methylobacterium nodulans]
MMVVRPRPGLIQVLFTLQGSILPKVIRQVAGITAAAFLVVAVERHWPQSFPGPEGIGPFTLVGLALSIFLSFRNNSCYDRWWEARKQWGALIAETRDLVRLIGVLLQDPAEAATRRACLRRVAGFAHALHARLRSADEAAAARPWLPDGERLEGRASPTDAVLGALAADLAGALRRGALSDILFAQMQGRVAALSQIHTACERIQSTPLPFAYTLLLYRTAWIYCLLLPFGLAASLGWATPAVAALVAYTFFGLDVLGDELEEPFGLEPNDLPLDAMLRGIERIVCDALGEPLPPVLRPEGGVLR